MFSYAKEVLAKIPVTAGRIRIPYTSQESETVGQTKGKEGNLKLKRRSKCAVGKLTCCAGHRAGGHK